MMGTLGAKNVSQLTELHACFAIRSFMPDHGRLLQRNIKARDHCHSMLLIALIRRGRLQGKCKYSVAPWQQAFLDGIVLFYIWLIMNIDNHYHGV